MTALRQLLRWLITGQLPAHARAYLQVRLRARRLAASPLFDGPWYQATYDDVGPCGIHPALHYCLTGAAQGRRPSPDFDGEAYLAGRPELRAAGVNPLLHRLAQAGPTLPVNDPMPTKLSLPRLPLNADNYTKWISACDTLGPADHAAIAGCTDAMLWRPRFTIILSSARPTDDLAPVLTSLLAQTYPYWELLLASPGSFHGESDPRIRQGDTADATGDFLLFLTPAIRLAATALFELSMAAAADTDLIYADEDQIDEAGIRHSPWFKPGWDPDLLSVQDFLGQACAWRRSRLESSRVGPGLADPGMLALDRARIRNVPAILFHRRDTPQAARPITRVHYSVPNPEPLVSIIVPTRDRARLLRNCIDGVLNHTAYRNIELLIVDNDSRQARTHRLLRTLCADPRVRVLHYAGPFNWSAMNNLAAAQARGEVLLLLNNDVEVILQAGRSGWLHEMVGQALRPEVGAVGARLLFPDGRLQHAGITLGAGAGAAHPMRHADIADIAAPLGLDHVRGVAAATGACLAIRRSVFHEVGGIEAEQLGHTHNDIDLCLRLRDRGYRVIVTPHASLIHHEAATRGPDATAAKLRRVAAERAYLVRQWGTLAQIDPYLNSNLTIIGDRLAFAQPPPARAWGAVNSASPSHNSLARPRSA